MVNDSACDRCGTMADLQIKHLIRYTLKVFNSENRGRYLNRPEPNSFASSITAMSFSITLRDVSKLVVIVVCCWKVDTTTFWRDSTSPALKSTFSARCLHNTRSIWPVFSFRLHIWKRADFAWVMDNHYFRYEIDKSWCVFGLSKNVFYFQV